MSVNIVAFTPRTFWPLLFVLSLPTLMILYWLICIVTPFLAIFFPSDCYKVEDLVYRVVSLSRSVLGQDHALSDNEIWIILLEIISEVLGVRQEEITPELRFIEDLNI